MPARERILLATAMDASGLRPTPLQFYVTGDESLEVTLVAQQTPLPIIRVTGRFWRELDGAIIPFDYSYDMNTMGASVTDRKSLGAGALLNLCVSSENTGFAGQLAFARVRVMLGLDGPVIPLGTLVQGYIATHADLAWPGTPLQRMDDGMGVLVPAADWQPALGTVTQTVTVPANQRWLVEAATCLVVTGAVAGVRLAALTITKDGQTAFASDHPVTFGANQIVLLSVGAGLVAATTAPALRLVLPLPDRVWLEAGDSLQFILGSALAGDSVAGQQLIARSWLLF